MPSINADGAAISYEISGRADAPWLVFSNSLGTNLAMWDGQAAAFGADFRILRYDSRGHGKSDVPPGPYTIERLGRDVLALMDGLGIERARFCGLSKGGMVGMWLAANAPQRIERLVLCNTAAYLGQPELWNQRIEAVRQGGMAAVAPGVIERWFTPEFRARETEAVDRVRAMLLSTRPEGYASCSAAIRDMDQREAIRGITAPTLVVSGTRDPATPPEKHEEIAARIAGAKLVMLEAAHLSNIEAQDAFNTAVSDFLKA